MIFYLTYNDLPSGIFSSQVIDVVNFLSRELGVKTRLVSFISLRKFSENRKKIKKVLPDAIVIPMFPGVHRWKLNTTLLKAICMVHKPDIIIGRSVLATQLALRTNVRKKIYDGRGAIAAEWKEYRVVTHPALLSAIEDLEREVIHKTDYRIAVSRQLIKHWQTKFGYSDNKHVIIPCTINKVFEETKPTISGELRKKLGFSEADILFVYSGSLAGWQSFDLLYTFISGIFAKTSSGKLLLLSDKDEHVAKLEQEFPGRVSNCKLTPNEVPTYLMAADYGLLIREESITNEVASPVKFAEYLACGLKVIISDKLGDYSQFVKENNCGSNYKEFKVPEPLSLSEKQRIRALALKHFTKSNHKSSYAELLLN